jgi:hypothetical protein
MVGERPVFYLLLPRSIHSSDELKTFVSGESMSQIAPLVRFDKVLTRNTLSRSDTFLAEFFEQNGVEERGVLPVRGDAVATIEFSVTGELRAAVLNLGFCLGQGDSVATCYQGTTD